MQLLMQIRFQWWLDWENTHTTLFAKNMKKTLLQTRTQRRFFFCRKGGVSSLLAEGFRDLSFQTFFHFVPSWLGKFASKFLITSKIVIFKKIYANSDKVSPAAPLVQKIYHGRKQMIQKEGELLIFNTNHLKK